MPHIAMLLFCVNAISNEKKNNNKKLEFRELLNRRMKQQLQYFKTNDKRVENS
jgi:hypothetical protein